MSFQLSLDLRQPQNFSLENFVVHSGVVESYDLIKNFIGENFSRTEITTNSIVLTGSPGCGKTHLIKAFTDYLLDFKINSRYFLFDSFTSTFYNSEQELIELPYFINSYQETKLSKEIIFLECRGPILREKIDPHLYSRLFSGLVAELKYPSEQELSTVLSSILDRYGIKLTNKQLFDVISVLPAVPMSLKIFSDYLSKALKEGRRFNRLLINDIVSTY